MFTSSGGVYKVARLRLTLKFIMMFTKENEGGKIDETSEVTRTERSGKLLDAEEAALGKHTKENGTVSIQFAFRQNGPPLSRCWRHSDPSRRSLPS